MITCEFEDGGRGKLRHAIVDGIIIKNGQIRLARRAPRLLEGGKWALIGGYMERDETDIQALEREVLEETGWKITNPQLLTVNSAPTQPGNDRQNVGLVFTAIAIQQIGTPDDESTDVQWFDLDALPAPEQMAFDHLDLIMLYQQRLAHPQDMAYIR